MRFVIQLGCGACLMSFRTVVEGRPCPGGGPHAHLPMTGVIELWGAAHHQPGVLVLGPAPRRA